MKILWSEKYSVGNKKMDEQHKMIFEIINNLNKAIDNDSNSRDVAKILFEMSKYVELHFKTEESLMRKAAYPNLHDQLTSHEAYIFKTIELLENYNADPESVDLVELNNYLFDWISKHILNEDMKYKEYLKDID